MDGPIVTDAFGSLPHYRSEADGTQPPLNHSPYASTALRHPKNALHLRAVPDSLLEIWQANAAGRYRHIGDQWPAPLDPHFNGMGRVVTDSNGHYQFTTVKPGAYPWRNHHNAWRPAHIHFSVVGRAFTQRLVTQMYFPDDPLFFQDPIFNSVPDAAARNSMISSYDHDVTTDHWALGFRFDLVLRGRDATPFESEPDDE
jgi:protocatechuate 3,4-dioxygenase beta subunit